MTDPGKTQRGRERLSAVQAVLGVVLAAYVVFHLWQQWPALEGREAWFDRARAFGLPLGLKLALGAAFAIHALLGLARLRAPHPADTSGGPALRRIQVGLGALLLAFLAIHVPAMQWSEGPHATVRDVYAWLWDNLGKPSVLAIYVSGALAMCAHLGLGLGRAADTLRASERSAFLYRAGAFALASLLFVCWLQVIAVFAIGEPLFFPPTPIENEAAP